MTYDAIVRMTDSQFQQTGVTFQTGQDSVVRNQFVQMGTLQNTQDTDFRAVNEYVAGNLVDCSQLDSRAADSRSLGWR